jgi:hypothetical protein
MLMTRSEFNTGAVELYEALSFASKNLRDMNEKNEQCIMLTGGWFLENERCSHQTTDYKEWSVVSLVHQPILRRRKKEKRDRGKGEWNTSEEVVLVEDSDPMEGSIQTVEQEEDSTTFQSHDEGWIEWNLSVVYSDTWGAPVLYFQVQSTDGTKLMRDEVLHELGWDQENLADHWQFISEDENPITGAPSYFLHPCQTSECLLEMFELDASYRKDYGNVMETFHLLSKGQVLLCWLALMLPSLKAKVSSRSFSELRQIVQDKNRKNISGEIQMS